MKHINYCNECCNYTMKEICCGKSTKNIKPQRYTQKEIVKEYRRKAKDVADKL